MMQFGLVGCGLHGERYLRHLSRGDVPGAGVHGLFRRTRRKREALAEKYAVVPYASERALVESPNVDALLVTTPPGEHESTVMRAVERGLPVLLEKPVTGDWASARRLREAVGEEAPVMVAQTLRFHPLLQRVREVQGRIGAVHRVRIAQRLAPSPLAWQRDARLAGGGSLVLTGVHLFDLARWIVGRTPDAVSCRWLKVGDAAFENCFDALLEFEPEGILVSAEVSKFSRARSSRLEMVGTEGQLVADYGSGTLALLEGSEDRVLETVGVVPTLPPTVAAFVEWRAGRSACPVSLGEAAEAVRVSEACYRSHDEGRRVRLDEVG